MYNEILQVLIQSDVVMEHINFIAKDNSLLL